ncbi:MAG: hypothetical protein HQ471_01715 [Flavobacteriales bacterium]|jgi:hypothetical protein|nr:hypothetical protein [Flavobacteriales bacterium]
MIKQIFFLIFIIVLSCSKEQPKEVGSSFLPLNHQEPYTAGKTYYGFNNYIEYIAGNLPIIIVAPHGGSITPSDIPDRTFGTIALDTNTAQLSMVIADSIKARFGKFPHLIICRLKRTKLDANRNIDEAAQGNAIASHSWEEFHHYIEAAKTKITQDYGNGLYLDIHGHGINPDGFYDLRIWLGYLLTGEELDLPDNILNSDNYKNKSSIKMLAETSRSDFFELIRGSSSFGSLLENSGYASVPSNISQSPQGSRFFSGGYNTLRHGSKNSGLIDAIQLELPKTGIRNNQAEWSAFSGKLTDVLNQYFEEHYEINLSQ